MSFSIICGLIAGTVVAVSIWLKWPRRKTAPVASYKPADLKPTVLFRITSVYTFGRKHTESMIGYTFSRKIAERYIGYSNILGKTKVEAVKGFIDPKTGDLFLKDTFKALPRITD